jgi:hypothetical protein
MPSSSDSPAIARPPRWVYVSGAIAIVLVVAFAVLHLAGFHGGHTAGEEPARHTTGAGHAP